MPDTGFKFTSNNETVVGATNTIAAGDSLLDSSTLDNDVLNVAVTGATALGTIRNIETINLTTSGATGASAISATAVSGLKAINISGTAVGNITLNNFGGGANTIGNSGVTTIDATGLTTNVGIVVNSSASTATAGLTIKGAFGDDQITGGLGADIIN
ncbi:MAG: hypothetical protein GX086_06785 [Alcaligenaceae bacterium]|nr:hypothetical protein [Alcaligenaceae bacterium]